MQRFLLSVLLTFACVASSGCVRRTLRISSTPPGALVWVNHREVGRTPLEIDFTYYGNYDVQLSHDDHEPLLTEAGAHPPAWDVLGADLLFEVAPFQMRSVVEWHFDLEPRSDDLEALVERARSLRSKTAATDDSTRPMTTVTVDADGRVEGAEEDTNDDDASAR